MDTNQPNSTALGTNGNPLDSLLQFISDLIETDPKLNQLYQTVDTNVKAFQALTSLTVNEKPVVVNGREMGQKDLAILALETIHDRIEKDMNLITFQRSFLALAIIKLMIDDWDGYSQRNPK